jgi:predicted DNA-binding protein
MAKKITVYVEEELHRRLKATASLRGQTLSDFMLQAARLLLEMPDRSEAAAQMDRVRQGVALPTSGDELRRWREEGRL